MKPYYEHAGITIYHGDCREILPLLPESAAIVCDPQYQLANGDRAKTMNSSRGEKFLKGITVKAHDWGKISGDSEPFDPQPFIRPRRTILWGGIHYSDRLPRSTSWLIWDKRGEVAPDDNADAEFAWTNLGGPVRIFRHLWKGVCRDGKENIAIQGSKLHPFQKPLALMKWCIGFLDESLDIIDPQAGSATTLLAAKELGRKAIGIEIEEKYCEIAAKRLSQEVFQF